LWLEGFEHDTLVDLHVLIRNACPLYFAQCCLDEKKLPIVDEKLPLIVEKSTLSTFWKVIKTEEEYINNAKILKKSLVFEDAPNEGLYTHVALFVLLGDIKTNVENLNQSSSTNTLKNAVSSSKPP